MPQPHVLAFAGHIIDAPTRAAKRFPPEAEPKVAAALRDQLRQCSPVAGVTGLASGSDILFAEALLDAGAELHVVLPVAEEPFLAESVAPPGPGWVARFHKVLPRAHSKHVYSDVYFQGSGTPFQLAGLLIDGFAQHFAEQRHAVPLTLAVWDGLPGDGLGGTASFVGHAVSQGRRTACIHPSTGQVFAPGAEAMIAAQKHSWKLFDCPPYPTPLEHRLCSFLFADAKGFSALTELQIPSFMSGFVTHVAQLLRATKVKPLVLNTWGDGLLVVTNNPCELADIALRLVVPMASAIDASTAPVRFRAGLHCGPAFFVPNDPLTGRPNVYGADVSRAARIEPVTAPGEVWASEAFAILAKATGARDFHFQELGRLPLAKGATGVDCLYRVTRRLDETSIHPA